MNPDTKLIIPQVIIQKAVDYLVTQPYKDVSQIISDISNNSFIHQEPRPPVELLKKAKAKKSE